MSLMGFSDSDWAGCYDERKSTTRYVFYFDGIAFSWLSKKQPVVALFTCEVEYIAAFACVCQAIWLRKLLEEMKLKQVAPTKVYIDNRLAIALAKNHVYHEKTKHIDTRYNHIRD